MGLLGIKRTRAGETQQGRLRRFDEVIARFVEGDLPSFSSKRGHVTEKHVLTGCKHDMLGNQTFEVRRPLSKLSHQSWKAFDVFDKQILPKLQTRYSSVQGFQK